MDDELSPRETEVLDRLIKAETTETIAAGMFISVATVRNHIQSIMTKTGTHTRLEAVTWALQAIDRGASVLAWCRSQGWNLTDLAQLLIVQAFLSHESGCDGGAHQWPVRRQDKPWTCLCGAMTLG